MIDNIFSLMKFRFLLILLFSGVLVADGPDGYGYTVEEDTNFNWIEISNYGTLLTLGDDDFVSIRLPFFVPFYNHLLNSIHIVSNGFLCDTNIYDSRNYPLPYSETNNLLALLWIDLAPNQGGEIYVYGDTNIFVVEWNHVPVYMSSNDNTFEIIFKPNGDIIFQYLHLDPQHSNSVTTGIQGNYGQNNFFLLYSYNGTPHQLHDSLRIVFTRPNFIHDVGIFDVEPDEDTIFLPSDSTLPLVRIKNYGQVMENVNIRLQITLNDSVIHSNEEQISIASDSVISCNFPWFYFTNSGKYTFLFTIQSGQDQEPSNDSFQLTFYCVEAVETFEDSSGGFKAIPQTGWEWGTPQIGPDSALSGVNLWGTVLDGNYYDNSNMILESPEYVVTGNSPSFGFYHWYHMERRWDGGNVLISTDFGRTWSIVEPDEGYPYQSIQALSYQPGFSGRSHGWEPVKFTIPLNKGQHVRIRLHFASGTGVNYEGWYVDDFWTIGLQPYIVTHDVGPVKIVTPSGLVDPNSPIAVLGTVENFGLSTDTFDVFLTIIDTLTSDTVFMGNTSVITQPGESRNVAFGSVILDDSSYYRVIMITNLPNDDNPSNDTLISFARTGIGVGDLMKFIPLDPVTGDNQNLGITTDGHLFYISGGNRGEDPNKLYIVDSTGFVVTTINQPPEFTDWGWSDLTFDGTNFYACYGHYVYKFTITDNEITLTDSFETPLYRNKAITVDPGTKHFYIANGTSSIYCLDSTGGIISSWSNSLNIQGIAFDTTTGHLWLSVARSDSNIIYEFDPLSGCLTGRSFSISLPTGYNHGLAGRMDFLISSSGIKQLIELVQGDPTDYLAFIYLGQTNVAEKINPVTSPDIFTAPVIAFNKILIKVNVPCDLTLYSSDGRVVKKVKAKRRFIRITTADIHDGVYFIEGKTKGKTQIKRLIILK